MTEYVSDAPFGADPTELPKNHSVVPHDSSDHYLGILDKEFFEHLKRKNFGGVFAAWGSHDLARKDYGVDKGYDLWGEGPEGEWPDKGHLHNLNGIYWGRLRAVVRQFRKISHSKAKIEPEGLVQRLEGWIGPAADTCRARYRELEGPLGDYRKTAEIFANELEKVVDLTEGFIKGSVQINEHDSLTGYKRRSKFWDTYIGPPQGAAFEYFDWNPHELIEDIKGISGLRDEYRVEVSEIKHSRGPFGDFQVVPSGPKIWQEVQNDAKSAALQPGVADVSDKDVSGDTGKVILRTFEVPGKDGIPLWSPLRLRGSPGCRVAQWYNPADWGNSADNRSGTPAWQRIKELDDFCALYDYTVRFLRALVGNAEFYTGEAYKRLKTVFENPLQAKGPAVAPPPVTKPVPEYQPPQPRQEPPQDNKPGGKNPFADIPPPDREEPPPKTGDEGGQREETGNEQNSGPETQTTPSTTTTQSANTPGPMPTLAPPQSPQPPPQAPVQPPVEPLPPALQQPGQPGAQQPKQPVRAAIYRDGQGKYAVLPPPQGTPNQVPGQQPASPLGNQQVSVRPIPGNKLEVVVDNPTDPAPPAKHVVDVNQLRTQGEPANPNDPAANQAGQTGQQGNQQGQQGTGDIQAGPVSIQGGDIQAPGVNIQDGQVHVDGQGQQSAQSKQPGQPGAPNQDPNAPQSGASGVQYQNGKAVIAVPDPDGPGVAQASQITINEGASKGQFTVDVANPERPQQPGGQQQSYSINFGDPPTPGAPPGPGQQGQPGMPPQGDAPGQPMPGSLPGSPGGSFPLPPDAQPWSGEPTSAGSSSGSGSGGSSGLGATPAAEKAQAPNPQSPTQQQPVSGSGGVSSSTPPGGGGTAPASTSSTSASSTSGGGGMMPPMMPPGAGMGGAGAPGGGDQPRQGGNSYSVQGQLFDDKSDSRYAGKAVLGETREPNSGNNRDKNRDRPNSGDRNRGADRRYGS